MENAIGCLIGCAVFLLLLAVVNVASAAVVMLAWNWAIPVLFHGPHISYLAAIGMTLLASFIAGLFVRPGASKD